MSSTIEAGKGQQKPTLRQLLDGAMRRFGERQSSEDTSRRFKSRIHGSGIYLLTLLPTRDTYVGQAKSLTGRWASHCSGMGYQSALPGISRVVARHKIEEVRFRILKRCDPRELCYWEAYYWLECRPTMNTAKFPETLLAQVLRDHPSLSEPGSSEFRAEEGAS